MSIRRHAPFGLLFPLLLATLPALADSSGASSGSLDAQSHRHRPVRIQLELQRPQLAAPLLSGCATTIPIPYLYTGPSALKFALTEGPPGMTIENASGTLVWTPPASAEGTAPAVRVAVTDGVASAALTFTLAVAAPVPIATSVAGSTLRITAPGSLSDVTFTFPSSATTPPALVTAGQIDAASVPPLPTGYTLISDAFRLTPSESHGDPLVVTIPSKLVPAGRNARDVRLLLYTDAYSESDGREWIPTWANLDVKADGSVTIALSAIGDLSCFAIADRAAAAVDPPVGIDEFRPPLQPDANQVSCQPLRMSNGQIDSARQVCTVTGDVDLRVTIKDADTNQWQPKASATDIATWLGAARRMLPGLGLTAAEDFEAVIEPIPAGDYGFVTSRENYRVLHLNSAAYPGPLMQGSTVHEYFHLAQAFSFQAEHNNLIREAYQSNAWVSEGTARWFEDEVFDNLDTYRDKEDVPAPQILVQGLNAFPNKAVRGTRPYARFAFFKLVSQRCPDFKVADAVNGHSIDDFTGLADLTEHLPTWRCSFADKVPGIDPDSLEAALLEYAYITVGQNAMGWLDSNELSFNFTTTDHLIYPETTCTSTGACPSWARRQWTMRASSAATLRVAPIDSVPSGREAVIQIRTLDSTEVMAWVGSDESGGIEGGKWLRVDGTSSVVYKTSGRAPRMFVVLVSGDPDIGSRVEIRSMLRGTGPQEVTTPISATFTYQPADVVLEQYVKGYVTWSGSVTGSVTAPENVPITVSRNESRVVAKACAPNSSAFTIVMTAGLSAMPSIPNGKRPHPHVAGAELEWLYSNPRVVVAFDDPSVTANGNTITATVPVVKNAWFGRVFGGCIAYDLDYWTVYPDGRKQKFGETHQTCQTGVLLDLRVGGPPDCNY